MRLASAVAALLACALPMGASVSGEPELRSGVRVVAADRSVEPAAAELARRAPAIVDGAARRLGLAPPHSITIVLARGAPRSEAERDRLGVGPIPPWAAGIAQSGSGRMILFMDRAARYPHRDLSGIVAHETVHLILGARSASRRIPRWYNEGLAMVVERETSFEDAVQLAKMTVLARPIPFEDLERGWPADELRSKTAYAQSLSLVGMAEDGAAPGAAARLVAGLDAGESFGSSFVAAYGRHPAELVRIWRKRLFRRYVTLPVIVLGAAVNVAMGLLAVAAYVRVRRRRRRILEDWDLEERWFDSGRGRFNRSDPGGSARGDRS